MPVGKYIIGYIRVSTQKQGESGLGLEAQERALQEYARSANGIIIKTYREVETGKGNGSNRPELVKALAHCRRAGATLVIAKLDRLARNVAFVANLMESKVDFVCCDNPHANRLTIHILAAVAEDEARAISQRTKDALATYKARGGIGKKIRERYPDGVPEEIVCQRAGKLGAALPENHRFSLEDSRKGTEASKIAVAKQAYNAYLDIAPEITELRKSGLSLRAIADRLNAEGHTSRYGKKWSAIGISRVLQRFTQNTP
jgi:DNA invertase Pin-like site-specific DNA recombinase